MKKLIIVAATCILMMLMCMVSSVNAQRYQQPFPPQIQNYNYFNNFNGYAYPRPYYQPPNPYGGLRFDFNNFGFGIQRQYYGPNRFNFNFDFRQPPCRQYYYGRYYYRR
jgi:hypothetical protein